MRDLTKSAFSFSWAMSMFGAQQIANLFSPAKAAGAFDLVKDAAREEFEEPLQTLFVAGDRLQSELIDLTFGLPAASVSADEGAAPPFSRAEQISSAYPFAPHYVKVFGSEMHYVDEGKGEPILLVHGNATWSYVWRNVIPHLTPYGRCIAPDLIGFGLSGKPDIEYTWAEQADYLEEFIQQLGLKNITLVLNDFGISLAMRYAMRHEHNVKGMAFFEGVFKTFASLEEAYTADFRPLFKQFRSGGKGGEGYQLLVDQNLFIEQLLPRAAGRELTEEELQRYREPFKEVRSRIPIWQFARSVPIGGEPGDVWNTMTEAVEWFKETNLPKLLFYGTPGGLVTAEFVEWCRRNLKHLKVVHVGPGVHYLTESNPHLIGRELARWIGELREPHEQSV